MTRSEATVRLHAVSDLHLANPANREALAALPSYGADWLILGGDLGETEGDLEFAFSHAVQRFARVLWVPGNHELWSVPVAGQATLRGEARYARLVAICRRHGVLTPEDPYPLWTGEGGPHLIAPLFVGYDYSFRPDDVTEEGAVAWAEESGVLCTDEHMLHPDPYRTLPDWCRARCAITERRLAEAAAGVPMVLVNHYPLDERLVDFKLIPRFSIWCGTRRTRGWPARFGADTVVYGHLHRRRTDVLDGVRFEEVSLGYPRDWGQGIGMAPYVRQILPAPAQAWSEPSGWVRQMPPAWLFSR